MFTLKVYNETSDTLQTDMGVFQANVANNVLVSNETGETLTVLESVTDENGKLEELTVE